MPDKAMVATLMIADILKNNDTSKNKVIANIDNEQMPNKNDFFKETSFQTIQLF
ncbi:hypothetical protein ACSVDE_07745 [Pseudalkalibacillus sp. Hm43]|uniref:hypothetical protein n=1 Tax=Pseudalkalibacillus sp. Hm43 TaxID=3450742 RepID=UPI003F4392DB